MYRPSTVIPLFREISRSMGECVSLPILITRAEGNQKVILGQEAGPTCLPPVEERLSREVLQVVVVSKNNKQTLKRVKINMPFLQTHHNCKKFFISYSIIRLGRGHSFRQEGNRVQDSFAILKVFLRQDSGNNIIRGVSLQYGFQSGVKVLQDWGSTESFLEFVEYLLTFR